MPVSCDPLKSRPHSKKDEDLQTHEKCLLERLWLQPSLCSDETWISRLPKETNLTSSSFHVKKRTKRREEKRKVRRRGEERVFNKDLIVQLYTFDYNHIYLLWYDIIMYLYILINIIYVIYIYNWTINWDRRSSPLVRWKCTDWVVNLWFDYVFNRHEQRLGKYGSCGNDSCTLN